MNYLFFALALGIFLGYKGVLNSHWESAFAKMFNLSFFALLAALGAKMAASPEVFLNIGAIGIKATLLSVCTSLGAALVTYMVLHINPIHGDEQSKDAETFAVSNVGKTREGVNNLKLAAIPIMVIAAGGVFGYLISSYFTLNYDLLVTLFLNLLILGIGTDIGKSRHGLAQIRQIGWIALAIPLSSLVGSMLGGIVAGLLLSLPAPVFLAIGAGSGFYSVVGPLVAEAAGVQLGALALLSNFFREIITIVFIPFFAIHFRHIALVGIGGATTMDTTLPVIARALGPKAVIVALIHGMALTFFVPILVPFLLSWLK